MPLFATPKDKVRGGKGGSGRKRRRGKKPGRKPKGPRAGSPHKKRPLLRARHPVHVVLRVVSAVGNLRHASAVFFFDRGKWHTDGRAIFNLAPNEALEHFKNQYQRLETT